MLDIFVLNGESFISAIIRENIDPCLYDFRTLKKGYNVLNEPMGWYLSPRKKYNELQPIRLY